MAKMVKLDRSDWSKIQFGSGVPGGGTPGNIYIDTNTAHLYVRKQLTSSWFLIGGSLDDGYDLFGNEDAIVTIDNAQGQGDLRFDVTSTSVFKLLGSGSTALTVDSNGVIYFGSGTQDKLTPTAGEVYFGTIVEFDDFIYADAGIVLGTSTSTTTGSVRYDSGDIEGYVSTGWVSLTGLDTFGAVGIYGFENNTDTTIAFNDSTYVFTLGDAGSGWTYYRNGIRNTISGDKTVTLPGSPPTAGIYYIYIDDNNGTLTASTSIWTLTDTKVLVAVVVWNSSNTPKYFLADERHKCTFPRRVHWNHHYAEGCELKSGGTLEDYVIPPAAPSGDDDNTFTINTVELMDEDILHTLAVLTDPSGSTLDYLIYYKTGVDTWSWIQSEVPFAYQSDGYIKYDNSGTLTEGQNVKYYNYYLVFTHFKDQPRYLLIPGQGEFDSSADAYEEEVTDLDLSGLVVQEAIIAYQLTYVTNSSYSVKGKCKLVREPLRIDVDSRTGLISGGTIDHNTTGGIQGGNGSDQNYHLTAAAYGYLYQQDQSVYSTSSPEFSALTIGGNITLTSGGSILSTDNGNVELSPNGTGIVKISSGTDYVGFIHNATDVYEYISKGSKVVEHIAPTELADDATFDLPNASAGFGTILVDNGEEYVNFYWNTSGTVILVNNTPNVVSSDTDGKFCIFDNGTQVRVSNRLGSAKSVIFNYHFTTSP